MELKINCYRFCPSYQQVSTIVAGLRDRVYQFVLPILNWLQRWLTQTFPCLRRLVSVVPPSTPTPSPTPKLSKKIPATVPSQHMKAQSKPKVIKKQDDNQETLEPKLKEDFETFIKYGLRNKSLAEQCRTQFEKMLSGKIFWNAPKEWIKKRKKTLEDLQWATQSDPRLQPEMAAGYAMIPFL